jgi:uncharacterized membrane protein YqjE
MSTVTTEEAVVDGVNKKLFIGESRFVIGLFIGLHVCFWRLRDSRKNSTLPATHHLSIRSSETVVTC